MLDPQAVKLIIGGALLLVATVAAWPRLKPAGVYLASLVKRAPTEPVEPIPVDPQMAAVHCYRNLLDRMESGGTDKVKLEEIRALVWPEIGRLGAK